MASLWNYISGLFRGAPSSPTAADPNAALYGQPVGVADLPAALPQQPAAGANLQLTGSYFDPSKVRLPGMSGGSAAASLPQKAPEPDPSPAPQDTPAFGTAPPPIDPTSLPQAPVMPRSNHVGDVLDNIFLGGSFRRAREAEYADQAKNYSDALTRAVAQRNRDLVASLPQKIQAAAALSPDKTGEALASNAAFHALSEGQTGVSGDGSTVFAPKIVTDNGRINVVTPQGARELGNTGPSFNADGLDARGLTPQANFNKPAPIDSTVFNSGGTYALGGGAAGLPQLPQSGAAGPGGAQPAGAPPRGLRNNNPGNVRALPNGQQWQGQTGVDDQGYATFDTPQSGIRATLTNLHSYGQLHGVNTVQGVVDRWAPASGGNDPAAYGSFVAQRLGVKPTDKIDLNDPKTLGGVAQAIFDFENGGGSAQPAPAGIAPQPRSLAGLPQKGVAPTGQASLKGGNFIRQLPPQEVAARGYAPGTIVLQKPNGDLDTKSGGTAWTPQDVRETRQAAMASPEYREAKASLVAFKALTANTGKMTGPNAYNILDTWIRTINPGATAKQGNIESVMAELGVPAEVIGIVQHLKGQGKLPLDIQQKIIDGVLPFVQGHWDQANELNQANADAATRHGYDPKDITAPLEARPERYVIPGQDGGPVRLDPKTADADFARLPKGAQFIGPDGKLRTKP